MPAKLRLRFASKDRGTVIDLVLIFAAVLTITLVTWPRNSARQVVLLQDEASKWQERSMVVTDPQLVEVRRLVDRWSHPEKDPEYATAKWRRETALHYLAVAAVGEDASEVVVSADEPSSPSDLSPPIARLSDKVEVVAFESSDEGKDDRSPDVTTASFADLSAGAGSKEKIAHASKLANEDRAQVYWQSVVDQSEQKIEFLERRAENVPASMGEVCSVGWPSMAINVGLLLGLMASCGYMHWARIAPLDRSLPKGQQPLRTLARIGTFSGVVCWSLLCCLLALIQS
ncbi:MAG: hypothetical protein AAF802_01600 [Planctomycetota bacterium]